MMPEMQMQVPTEAEWRLVAKVIGFTASESPVFQDGDLLLIGRGRFIPLHDHNDLARLVEAMRVGGWHVCRWAWSHLAAETGEEHETVIHTGSPDRIVGKVRAPTDLQATFWACVEALKKGAAGDG